MHGVEDRFPREISTKEVNRGRKKKRKGINYILFHVSSAELLDALLVAKVGGGLNTCP